MLRTNTMQPRPADLKPSPARRTTMAARFTLGVDLMDEDHARLEALLAAVPQTADQALPALLAEVEAETRAHFSREEDLMRARQVPILACHMVQHHLFLTEFAQGYSALDRQDMTGLRHFLEATLPAMLADHVTTVDRITAGFLLAGAEASPPTRTSSPCPPGSSRPHPVAARPADPPFRD